MPNYNKVVLIGHITRDLELRHTQGGSAIAKFGMAINRSYKAGDEKREETCFVDLVAFGKTAEIMSEHLHKGDPVFVEGRLSYSAWDDKDSGKKRSKLEVAVDNFQFLSGKEKSEAPAAPAKKRGFRTNTGGGADYGDGDVPFGWLIALPLLGMMFM